MTELKTLKDLRVWDLKELEKDEQGHVHIEELKAEGIKWVKFQKDIQMHNPRYFNEYRLNIQWIKHFFNITEEDLK